MKVYFIQHGDGPIKVGIAADAAKRIKEFALYCPGPIVVLGVIDGGRKLEKRIHLHLKADRHRGEWFKPTDTVKAFVRLAISVGQDGLEEEFARGDAVRSARSAALDALEASVHGALAFGVTLAAKAGGIDQLAHQSGVVVGKLKRIAENKALPSLEELTRLYASSPVAVSIFDILCGADSLDAQEVKDNRAVIEAARDALDELLRKVVRSAA